MINLFSTLPRRIRIFLFLMNAFSISLACDVKSSFIRERIEAPPNLDSPVKIDQDDSYIIVFGDLQTYTMGRYIEYYRHSCEWIRNQYDAGYNIQSILAVGDITQNNTPEQWLSFKTASDTVTSVIPYFVCVGNHDYSWSSSKIYDRSNTKINTYAHFPLTDEQIVDYYQDGDLANYVAKLNVQTDLMLLSLEFAPREEVLSWAIDYVGSHTDNVFVLMTHEWLTGKGERIVSGSDSESQLNGYSSYTLPEQIWCRLVSRYNNILCIICGHDGFSTKSFTPNDSGRLVPQILFNLQSVANGGNGLIQIWKFDSESFTVRVSIYDTINDRVYEPDVASFPYNIIKTNS